MATYEERLAIALKDNAALREAFIVNQTLPYVEERDGKFCLKEHIQVQVKSNEIAVEQYKEIARAAIENLRVFFQADLKRWPRDPNGWVRVKLDEFEKELDL